MWSISRGIYHVEYITWSISHGLYNVDYIMWTISRELYHINYITWTLSHGLLSHGLYHSGSLHSPCIFLVPTISWVDIRAEANLFVRSALTHKCTHGHWSAAKHASRLCSHDPQRCTCHANFQIIKILQLPT